MPDPSYRVGNSWRTTIVRVGTGEPDEQGRRPDDVLALQVIDAERPRDERELLARRTAELLAAVEDACDCGHEGQVLMFHLHPCPVAVFRDAARRP